MNEIPLKWTARGNVPLDSLREERVWKKDGRVLMLHLMSFDKTTGELLANDLHGYVLPMTLWQRVKAIFADTKVALKGAVVKAEGSL